MAKGKGNAMYTQAEIEHLKGLGIKPGSQAAHNELMSAMMQKGGKMKYPKQSVAAKGRKVGVRMKRIVKKK